LSTFSGDGHFKMTDSTPRLSVKVAAWTATPWDDGSGIQVLLGLYPIVTNFTVQLSHFIPGFIHCTLFSRCFSKVAIGFIPRCTTTPRASARSTACTSTTTASRSGWPPSSRTSATWPAAARRSSRACSPTIRRSGVQGCQLKGVLGVPGDPFAPLEDPWDAPRTHLNPLRALLGTPGSGLRDLWLSGSCHPPGRRSHRGAGGARGGLPARPARRGRAARGPRVRPER
jgi:hypothetical protein